MFLAALSDRRATRTIDMENVYDACTLARFWRQPGRLGSDADVCREGQAEMKPPLAPLNLGRSSRSAQPPRREQQLRRVKLLAALPGDGATSDLYQRARRVSTGFSAAGRTFEPGQPGSTETSQLIHQRCQPGTGQASRWALGQYTALGRSINVTRTGNSCGLAFRDRQQPGAI